MAAQIIPTINVPDKQTFEQHLRSVETHVDIVQIDVTDGVFTSWNSWHNPEEIGKMKPLVDFELQFMVNHPKQELKKWEELTNIQRIAIHVESMGDDIIDAFHYFFQFDYELSIAINPNTSRSVLEPILPNLTNVMFMGVVPGKSGQKFHASILKDILKLKQEHDHITIEVDGGVNESNIQAVVASGADIVCVGSAIFGNERTPAENLNRLKALL